MADNALKQIGKSQILVVDDDPIMLELARARLEESGHQVFSVGDGDQALEILTRERIDLVISDLDMPVMSGFELTRYIRSEEALKHTPVIVITGSGHESAVDEAFAAGATSFLAKPINWALFNHSVRFVLRASAVENALRLARDQAEAGGKFKDSLMSLMSHELRTPLNAIIGFGQILSEKFASTDDNLHKEYADYVVEGGRRLLDSISDMLLACDARSGPISIYETDATISEIVNLARKGLEQTIATSGANLSMALRDGEVEICCDRALVARAIAKLIDNAIKYCPRGVNVVVASSFTKSGKLAVMVLDDGPGIPSDKLRRALDSFAQSELSQRGPVQGLGLGLPLVSAIAKAHGAVFRVNSQQKRGTRALLLFPTNRLVTRGVEARIGEERVGAA